MKVKFQRFTSAFLALIVAAGIVFIPAPSVFAADPITVAAVGQKAWELALAVVPTLVSVIHDYVSDDSESEETENALFGYWTDVIPPDPEHYWLSVSKDNLGQLALQISNSGIPCDVVMNDTYGVWCIQCTNGNITSSQGAGGGRYSESIIGCYFRTASGQVPVAFETAGEDDDELPINYNRWVLGDTAVESTKVVVVTEDVLSELCAALNSSDRACSLGGYYRDGEMFKAIVSDSGYYIYCNSEGYPYVAREDQTVTNVDFDYIVNNNGDTVDNSQVIDMSNGTLNYIKEAGLESFFIDELIYDFASDSYSADTYNITYSPDNDTYNTYNYTWNITYNITNTYVTNIGQSELYEPLELYYELPDGRSSADLTAEDIVGMSFEFADVVNYEKSATDTYIRALYHFDGDTEDSSYFSTQGSFDWTTGASISYMDTGTFNGALHLGPENHAFNITLPSNFGPKDFTVQFRYYQAGAADTQSNIENSLAIGGKTLLSWDESNYYYGTDTDPIAEIALGAWQELALVRHNGTLYIYHNGLCIYSGSYTNSLSGEIALTLGETTRAYSMVDELRVLNIPVAENGASYTCTSVPFDTNLVLVLPDSAFPIADEYWSVSSGKSNYLPHSVDDYISGVVPDFIKKGTTAGFYKLAPEFAYVSTYTTLTADLGYLRIANTYSGTSTDIMGTTSSGSYRYAFESTVMVLEYNDSDLHGDYDSLLPGIGNYCFSVVLSDGTVCTLPFTALSGNQRFETIAEFDWGQLRYKQTYDNDATHCCVAVTPNDGEYVDIIYMELVEGTSTDLSAEWVTCMYSSEEVKPNTAAIQTDIPVNGYTVGGVRPTFPARGDVWMPVSNKRITACYIYTGSMWESVNARWYTGTRWIPIYAFDLETLQDYWDVADADKVVSNVATEQEFWNWWKNAWTDFRQWLDENGTGSGSGNGVNITPDADTSGLLDGILELIVELLKTVVEVAGELLTGIFSFLTDTVFDGISNFFAPFTDGSLLDGFLQTDDTGNTTTALPEGIPAVFAFFSGLFMVMPAELRTIMIFGISMLLLLAVFKTVKS